MDRGRLVVVISNQAMRPGPTSAGGVLAVAAWSSPVTRVEARIIAKIAFCIAALRMALACRCLPGPLKSLQSSTEGLWGQDPSREKAARGGSLWARRSERVRGVNLARAGAVLGLVDVTGRWRRGAGAGVPVRAVWGIG